MSELCGLTWVNVRLDDLDDAELEFGWQVDRKGNRCPTKTDGSARTVPIPRELALVLSRHKLAARDCRPDAFVFATRSGRSLSRDPRWPRIACESNGLTRTRAAPFENRVDSMSTWIRRRFAFRLSRATGSTRLRVSAGRRLVRLSPSLFAKLMIALCLLMPRRAGER